MLIVQKFGGTSLADAGRIKHAADIVAETYRAGHDVVVVVSAQGDTTDLLLKKAAEVNPNPSKRETDVLLTTGEQISMALVAMALEAQGLPAISLTGWQVGLQTDANHGNARVRRLSAERLHRELDKRRIVLVAGFQGINRFEDLTTLGRGGSDTTAVAIAASLHADLCQIYTDVDGIYAADPNKVPGARKLDEITFDEMLELAADGAQVLHHRAVDMAKRYNVNLEVLSSFEKKPGTRVKEVTSKVEQLKVSGVTSDKKIAKIVVVGLPDEPGAAFRATAPVAKAGVNIDIIIQSYGKNNTNDLSFTVPAADAERARAALEEARDRIRFERVVVDPNVAKVSVVGVGMLTSAGVASTMFEALSDAGINIQMITTSEIKISVLIDESCADMAVQAVYKKFFDEV